MKSNPRWLIRRYTSAQGVIGDAANAVKYVPDAMLIEFFEMGFAAHDFHTVDEFAACGFRKVDETDDLMFARFPNCVQDNTGVSTCTQEHRTVRGCLHSRAPIVTEFLDAGHRI
jgi:hypothetical protein